jgi:hypothetical protein
MNVIDFINDSMVTIKMTYGVERNRKLEDKQKTFKKMKKQKINKNKKKTKNKK